MTAYFSAMKRIVDMFIQCCYWCCCRCCWYRNFFKCLFFLPLHGLHSKLVKLSSGSWWHVAMYVWSRLRLCVWYFFSHYYNNIEFLSPAILPAYTAERPATVYPNDTKHLVYVQHLTRNEKKMRPKRECSTS